MNAEHPVLKPLNPESHAAMQREAIALEHFPYRVGRESRVGFDGSSYASLERRGGTPPSNDLYLLDRGERLNVSREHFQIEMEADGTYALVDCGSFCGTIVDGEAVGGHDRPGRCPLKAGSQIRVGTGSSPYLFEFVLP